MMKRCAVFVVAATCSFLWAQTGSVETAEAFKPLSFLFGTWEAKDTERFCRSVKLWDV